MFAFLLNGLCAIVLLWLVVDISKAAMPHRVGAIIAVFVAAGVVLFGVPGFGAFLGGQVGLLLGAAFYHFLTRGKFGPY